MNDTSFVRDLERLGNLLGQRNCLIDRDWPLRNAFSERLSIDLLKGQALVVVCLFEPADCDDAGLVDRCKDLGLTLEASKPIEVLPQLRWRCLHRHLPVLPSGSGEKVLDNATAAEFPRNFEWADFGWVHEAGNVSSLSRGSLSGG